MIESSVLHKLKPAIHELIELLKKAIDTKQPILLRHHADADGYTAGIALERALLPLISAKHRRERDAFYYYQRLPSLTPYYGYEDATKDIQTFLRNADQFEMKAPLILLLDFGSGAESLPAIQKVKIYGAHVAVVDHHPPDDHITQATAVHINPHLIGSTYDYSAGMLSAEIGHLIAHDNKELPDQHFYFIAAVSGTADKVASDEYKKYMAMASHHGFTKELVLKVAQALDYEAHVLGPTSGRELVQDLLGKDEKRQHKLLALIDKQLEKLFAAQLITCLHYAEIDEKKHFLFVKIPIETLTGRNSYPPRGRSVGLVQQHFVDKGKKALVVGIGQTSFNFRCNGEIKDFDVNGFIALCRKKLPHAQVSGGGHRVAGSITFLSAAYKEMLHELEEYVNGL
jgi:RecJ-like exonuclease